jgi:nucleotidyltransferase substrate binding protein (TIGR01987 family)
MNIGEIDISNFLKAREQFEEYRQNITRKQDRAGSIQAFEYTYEMAWKTMKRVLTQQGVVDVNAPRLCFREAAKLGLINDPKIWFYFIEIRNLTVYTYDEQNVEKVVASFGDFSKSLNEFIANLERIK